MGAILLIIGALLLLFSRLGMPRLPGDIFIQKPNLVVYIPVASAILISLIITLLLNLIFWRWRR